MVHTPASLRRCGRSLVGHYFSIAAPLIAAGSIAWADPEIPPTGAAAWHEEACDLVDAGRYGEARNAFEEARRISSHEQDPIGEGNALLGLAAVELIQHGPREARPLYAKALLLFRKGNSLVGQADVHAGLGTLERMLGRTREARSAYLEASRLFAKVKNQRGRAVVLHQLGDVDRLARRNDAARAAYLEAARLYRTLGMQEEEEQVRRKLRALPSSQQRPGGWYLLGAARAGFSEARVAERGLRR